MIIKDRNKISTNFTWGEMIVTNTGWHNNPNPDQRDNIVLLVDNVLQPARNLYGKPIITTSVFRNETVNKAVGGVATSQHLTGQAADIVVNGGLPELQKLFDIIRDNLPYDQLILEQRSGKNWIHVSYNHGKNRKIAMYAKYSDRDGKMIYSYA